MKIVHTVGMNTQRITVSMPNSVYKQLLNVVAKGKISEFVSEATEEKIIEAEINKKKDPIEAFLALGSQMPKLTDRQIKAAIAKGRT